jgi:hypothetical protein
MASASSGVAIASPRGMAEMGTRGASDLASGAWLCAIPCAAIVAAAMLLLGPPIGRLLSPAHNTYRFLPDVIGMHPEPTEHARYLIALGAPLLCALGTWHAPAWLVRVPGRLVRVLALVPQVALAGVVAASIVAQDHMRFGFIYTRGLEPTLTVHYFKTATLVVAVLLTAAGVALLRAPRLRLRAAAVLLDRRRRAVVAGAIAVLATVVWMLHAVHSDAELANAAADVRYHLGFTLDETFAVLNGRTPLVDFTTQYASLWPYAVALSMLALGKTALVFTSTLCVISGLALLGIYDVLRRATRSAIAALLLYLPFLATSLFMLGGTYAQRSSVASYYGTFPLRYALPYFVAWLTARRLERGGGAPSCWALFTLAGIGVINNGDFGVAALGASAAALLWAGDGFSRSRLLRLAGAAGVGLLSACALVSLLTLVRAGALPGPARYFDYPRIYTVGGFALMPIPGVLGVHLLIYLTFVAAIVVATVRARRAARNRVLTGMLAWSGVFGLGAGIYYVGRSHPEALKYLFSAWALALALLTVVAVRELAAERLRRTALGALVVLFGFSVAACSLAQTPTPWSQLQRLGGPFVPARPEVEANPLVPPSDTSTRTFVASLADGPRRFVYKRGAPVAILLTTGHRVADAYGVVDVAPYTGIESMYTVERLETTLDVLRAAGGNTVILPNPLSPSILPVLARNGFELLTPHGLRPYVRGRTHPAERFWPSGGTVMKWVDMRHLHPRALA